ncbi:MAG: GNAT family N-acetyltransferase [Bacteroidaceae bacterium]|jgi:hypothetical protein|nr:GNAT family N-acetyltransferase [Bacteroidaceae bacterium]
MIRIEQYKSGEKLPPLMQGIFFHSEQFFHILENSPGIKPVMLVAYDGDEEKGHLLAMLKHDFRIIPPGIYHWCSIYSEGVYADEKGDRNELFSMFLDRLMKILDFRYMFIEVRYITDTRITYRTFSNYNFVPRHDLRIYNSLHSRKPEERLSRAYHAHIRRAKVRGVTYRQISEKEEIVTGIKMLKKYYASKVDRYFAPTELLTKMLTAPEEQTPDTRMFAVYNKEGRMIGCSICLYSEGRAFLLYSCGLRKSYPLLYPGIMSVWAAIKDAHQRGYAHFEFAVSGMPLNKRRGFKNFLLNFGGKQTSTLRWYRFRWNWINKILRKIYV